MSPTLRRSTAAGAVALMLSGCASASSHPEPGASQSPTVAGTPSVSATLAAPPTNCGATTPTDVSTFGRGIGGLTAWAVGFDGPQATLHVANGPRTAYGWRAKVLMVVDASQVAPITITGRSDSGAALWFEIGGAVSAPPTTAPRLGGSTVPAVHGWKQFPSYVYVPSAGCYTLRTSWPGAGWTVRFAAGR